MENLVPFGQNLDQNLENISLDSLNDLFDEDRRKMLDRDEQELSKKNLKGTGYLFSKRKFAPELPGPEIDPVYLMPYWTGTDWSLRGTTERFANVAKMIHEILKDVDRPSDMSAEQFAEILGLSVPYTYRYLKAMNLTTKENRREAYKQKPVSLETLYEEFKQKRGLLPDEPLIKSDIVKTSRLPEVWKTFFQKYPPTINSDRVGYIRIVYRKLVEYDLPAISEKEISKLVEIWYKENIE